MKRLERLEELCRLAREEGAAEGRLANVGVVQIMRGVLRNKRRFVYTLDGKDITRKALFVKADAADRFEALLAKCCVEDRAAVVPIPTPVCETDVIALTDYIERRRAEATAQKDNA